MADAGDADWTLRVASLVRSYREMGHTLSDLDPLRQEWPPRQPLLELDALGFTHADLDRPASVPHFLGGRVMPLREMIDSLKKIYCGTTGYEFMFLADPAQRDWLRDKIEARWEPQTPAPEVQREILRHLLEAEFFERFLHTRFVGQKRFSVEGGESFLPMMEAVLGACASNDVEEIVLGMAHRGRLSVLANFLHKSLQTIFTEFSENYIPDLVAGDGDVKYHLGYDTTREIQGKTVEVRLAANPSHLEIVNTVVAGKARARQRVRQDLDKRAKVLPLLVHGDAAVIGQGITAELINMSQLEGYKVGGSLHLVINNQLGFTTLPQDGRSTRYCTDIFRFVDSPVFHVNGDDPEAVSAAASLAVEFRQKFARDVVVDLVCYRKYGHNEADEPAFTQPMMYEEIGKRPMVGVAYGEKLVSEGRLKQADVDALRAELEGNLEANYQAAKAATAPGANGDKKKFSGSTAVFQPPYSHEPVATAIDADMMRKIGEALVLVPEGFHVFPKLKKTLLDRRAQAWEKGGPFNWADGEALAFGSLLAEGTPVRLSGQDSRRGTFSHRLSVLYDVQNRERHVALNNLASEGVRFCVYNSPLSEAGVLGFDYGYSLDYPQMLCLWEAQFGDFANGAQVVIDQFIAAAESKWQRPSGIVLLLPHGYEGQGPEHSSARLERFLQLCAEDNLQVCNCTTPAQYFHLLRRQMKRSFLKPLVVMTPKSLLRADYAVSHAEDFTSGHFQEVIATDAPGGNDSASKVILCSGKIYYDLLARRDAAGVTDTALVRLEQLYPLNTDRLRQVLEGFRAAKRWVWCQEEPRNMGAWTYISPRLAELKPGQQLYYVGRKASASPAVGALARHKLEQKEIVEKAFSL